MALRTKDDEQNFYICGQCNTKIFYLKSDEAPDTCPECDVNVTGTTLVGQHGDGEAQSPGYTVRSKGWEHKERSPSDVPNEIKLDLSQY